MQTLLGIAAFVALVASAGCADRASDSDCEKLLNHMISLEMENSGTKDVKPEVEKDNEAQAKAIAQELHDEFLKQCTEETPASYVECALKKRSADKLDSCDRQ